MGRTPCATGALSPEEVLALPAAVDLATAGRALGIGRSTAFDLARRGDSRSRCCASVVSAGAQGLRSVRSLTWARSATRKVRG